MSEPTELHSAYGPDYKIWIKITLYFLKLKLLNLSNVLVYVYVHKFQYYSKYIANYTFRFVTILCQFFSAATCYLLTLLCT